MQSVRYCDVDSRGSCWFGSRENVELAIVTRTYLLWALVAIFILSVRLSSRATEDRRIIYPPTLHVLNTEVLGGTGFVRRMVIVLVFVR